ncbi:MAG: hypothetical protein MJZ27_11480 [Bacteroidales bacterium]|nr:hypothetical protein [Bacteroidales bacterium]
MDKKEMAKVENKDREIDLYSLEEVPWAFQSGEWNFNVEIAELATERLRENFKNQRCVFGNSPSEYDYNAMMMIGEIKDIYVTVNYEGDGEYTVTVETNDECYYYNMGLFAIGLAEEVEYGEE